jgi:hypothetical protein
MESVHDEQGEDWILTQIAFGTVSVISKPADQKPTNPKHENSCRRWYQI